MVWLYFMLKKFNYLYLILQTDDKGVFSTSLSHEYMWCMETFGLNQLQVTKMALEAIDYIFARGEVREILKSKFNSFVKQ